jgi:hypothetical protein
MNPVHTQPPCFFKIHYINFSHLRPCLPRPLPYTFSDLTIVRIRQKDEKEGKEEGRTEERRSRKLMKDRNNWSNEERKDERRHVFFSGILKLVLRSAGLRHVWRGSYVEFCFSLKYY